MEIFLADKGEEKGVLVDDDRTAAAITTQNGKRDGLIEMNELLGFSRDAHNDRGGRSFIHQTKIPIVVTQKSLFQMELVGDGTVV